MDATTPVVVDTDVVSFLFKAHPLASAYQAILAGRSLAVSLTSLAEIEYGMEAKNWGASRHDLMRRSLTRFTALLPNAETAWIAAAAVQFNVPLVTHNASDFGAVETLTVLTAATTI
jgi:tRNA(fMet)-specific endonuclease VapC